MAMLDRRGVLRAGMGGLAASTAMGVLPADRAAAADLTVGFIYVGPRDDYGYNQAHAEGVAAIKAMSGVTVIEEENVPETLDVQKTMESMIQLDGASLIFPTSFGYYDPHMLKMCEKYKAVQFRHCGGLWTAGKHPTNAGSYFGYIGEAQYVSGVVAANVTKSKKLGFVAAKPIPQVVRNVNSFTMGARSVDPSITVTVIFTGEWSMAVKEAEATNSLIDQGVDVITCHVDGPKVVIETAERRGIYTCGYHANQQALAPKGYLTGAEWNWAEVYGGYIKAAQAGQPLSNYLRGGLKEGFVKTSAYGPAVPEAVRKQADTIKARMVKEEFLIFAGPVKTNKGAEIIPGGKIYSVTDVWLESMDWLVEGVIGATA